MNIAVKNVRQVWSGRAGSEVVALEGFTHTFKSGRFSCILGPSGCGKSTLAQIIGGIETATSGGVEIKSPDDPGRSVALGATSVMVWQNQNLFPWRTTLENVAFGLEMSGVPKSERNEKARKLINSVGLRGFEKHFPSQLSGGMRQRAALARALMMDRPVLLMDEPFGALDAQTKIVMQEELLKIFEETRKTVIFVTHSIDEAILLGDEVVVMTARPGRIKEVIPVNLPRPRSFDLVNTPEFGKLFDKAFHLIRDEVTKAMAEMNRVDALT
jgi:NitT/TauT family transport system ATP-binding protein